MAETASVASRPEYCFNRRSRESGTVSSNSSGDRGGRAKGPANWLSFTSKSYARFLEVSSKPGRTRRLQPAASLTLVYEHTAVRHLAGQRDHPTPGSVDSSGPASTSSILY